MGLCTGKMTSKPKEEWLAVAEWRATYVDRLSEPEMVRCRLIGLTSKLTETTKKVKYGKEEFIVQKDAKGEVIGCSKQCYFENPYDCQQYLKRLKYQWQMKA
jgi:hypothetical protein